MNTADMIQIIIYIMVGIVIALIIAGCIIWKDWVKRLIAVGVLGIIVLQFVIFPVFLVMANTQGETRLSPYFTGYENVKTFYGDVHEYQFQTPGFQPFTTRCIVSSPTILNSPLVDPKDSLYICVGVEKRYNLAESEAILQFCANGGHAIIADDHGFVNDLSTQVGVLSLEGQFLDENFDHNQNFTIVSAHLSADKMKNGQVSTFAERAQSPSPDGLLDDDNDADGKIDEDPIDNIDNDEDNGKYEDDMLDNDFDGDINEPKEGVDEDPIDDDGDGEDNDGNPLTPAVPDGIDNDGDGEVDEGFNEEFIDGIDNDNDGYVDEDVFDYTLLLNDATGFVSEGTRVISQGSERSFVDMNGDGKISIPDANLLKKGQLADEISSPGHEIQTIVEVPISSDGTQIDVRNGDWIYPDGSRSKGHNPKEMASAGSIIFVSDPALFIDDEYTLDHQTFDVHKPYNSIGNGIDDDMDGYIDEDRELAGETGVGDNDAEKKDRNLVLDRTGGDYVPIPGNITDMNSAKMKYPASMLTKDVNGNIVFRAYDYDNAVFLENLVFYLMPKGGTVIFDESRHEQSSEFLVPVYKSLSRVTWLTSTAWLSATITLSAAIILAFAVMVIKEKENWVHIFNITLLSSRKNLPVNNTMQSKALRRALLEKVRIQRGLAPDEFKDLNETAIMASIKDPELRELVTNANAIYPSDKISALSERIRRLGK